MGSKTVVLIGYDWPAGTQREAFGRCSDDFVSICDMRVHAVIVVHVSNGTAVRALPPSDLGPATTSIRTSDVKHRMSMSLTFTHVGNIAGDGIDDVALFKIHGLCHGVTNQPTWTKSYVQR